MIPLFLFIALKIIPAGLVCLVVFEFLQAQRAGTLRPWMYWRLGYFGYLFVSMFAWGWIAQVDGMLQLFCAAGYLGSMISEAFTMHRRVRLCRATALSLISHVEEIRARLEAEVPHADH